MSATFADDLGTAVRSAASEAATAALTAFGAAAAAALVDEAPAFAAQALSGADTLGTGVVKALAVDLVGRVAHDVDANGLSVGDVTLNTQLVAFASGQAVSPVADVVVEHTFTFALGSVAALSAQAALTLRAECAFDAKSAAPKTTTTTKIDLHLTWSSDATGGSG